MLCLEKTPGHAAKNSSGQIASHSRTLYLGRYWVDLGDAYNNGLPAAAFCRTDGQSDKQHALCSCPLYYTSCQDFENLSLVTVSWASRGSLLWSLTTGMCTCPYLHKGLSVAERCEISVCGLLLFDIWQLLSSKMEVDRGARIGTMSMSPVTVGHLQNLSLNMVVMLLHKDVPCLKTSQNVSIYLWGVPPSDFIVCKWVGLAGQGALKTH